MESTYKQAFLQIIDFLEGLEENKDFKYYLVGGILVNLYSDFRIIRAIDIVIDLPSSKITLADYISLLGKNNFHAMQDWRTTLILARETNIIQFLDKTDTVRYDNHIVVKFSSNKYKKMGPIGLKKRVRERLFGIECWVTSKEDFLLSKLVYGGWQDYTDALGCWLRFQNEIDKDYLEIVSKQLDIEPEYSLLKSGIDDPDDFFNRLRDQ
ncbi:MAG TPA: hypothetical protein ENH75_06630 [archaeon]|nr:hypothetical protein [archaeon]